MKKSAQFIVRFNDLENCCRKLSKIYGNPANAVLQFAESLSTEDCEQLKALQHLRNMICHVDETIEPTDSDMQNLERYLQLAKARLLG